MLRKLAERLFVVAVLFVALGCSGENTQRIEDTKGNDRVGQNHKNAEKRDSRPKWAKITGKVTYDGKVVPVGTVIFIPEKGPAVSAEIEDGEYTADKVRLGRVAVAVSTALHRKVLKELQSKQKEKGAPGGEELAKQREKALAKLKDMIDVPEKFEDPKRSGLKYEIKPGPQVINIDLARDR